jgi:hypothetical protein
MFLSVDYLALITIGHSPLRPTAIIYKKFLAHSPGKGKHNQSPAKSCALRAPKEKKATA